MQKQEIIIRPEEKYSCKMCTKWNRYTSNSSWGICTMKSVPHYMREIFKQNGCNLHSNILNKKIVNSVKSCEYKQLSLF